ncbi:hypothetical protein [Brevibacterium casei]|uniref:Uncharacterized protein n=1 Tax=Brevibacterium casei CIP 102111 TaxID=1255625 RepID=A0A2H1IXZ1_9MICO|nr:hypothetical protein [Brevibacterium casei]QPR39542.1 hypothetical protein I6G94_01205 [Brevibacterium casei]QPR43707.1 hypothetical protein I6G93_16495 [Brevibacterium casei]SMX80063.1 hypothetical protein BC102111_01709 [Brevibacterium casei CIP 102111]
MTVKFGTPPPKLTQASKYRDDADTLRAHPGEWAQLNLDHLKPASRVKYSNSINSGKLQDFPRGDFEAMTRRGEVWVRYVGKASLRPVAVA